ncbi:MAG: MerR family transcriptional regulator [Egibacteraceae bacterium]
MRYHIDDLAAAAEVDPEAVARYQDAGLLPRASQEGSQAWYDDGHRQRLAQVRDLEADGVPLPVIRRMLDEDPADAALVRALTGPVPGEDDAQQELTREELAEATDLPVALLEALEREGLLEPRIVGGQARYSPADAEVLTAGMSLLAAGVPLDELLGLARRHDEAMRAIADEAVDLFVRFVRDPIQESSSSQEEASTRLVGAFRDMLPATGAIIAHHFRRLLLASAAERITADTPGEDHRAADDAGRTEPTDPPPAR